MRLRCPKCKYVWNYTGKSLYATCPRCYRKVNVEKNQTSNINIEEVKKAIDVIMKYYDMIRHDIETREKYKNLDFVCDVFKELFKKRGTPIPKKDLLEECRKRGLKISYEEFDELLYRLEIIGEIYEPELGKYAPIDYYPNKPKSKPIIVSLDQGIIK